MPRKNDDLLGRLHQRLTAVGLTITGLAEVTEQHDTIAPATWHIIAGRLFRVDWPSTPSSAQEQQTQTVLVSADLTPRRPRPIAGIAQETYDWIQAPVSPAERLQRLSRVAAEALALALRGQQPRTGGQVPIDGTEPDI